jgi:hypothetical protein
MNFCAEMIIKNQSIELLAKKISGIELNFEKNIESFKAHPNFKADKSFPMTKYLAFLKQLHLNYVLDTLSSDAALGLSLRRLEPIIDGNTVMYSTLNTVTVFGDKIKTKPKYYDAIVFSGSTPVIIDFKMNFGKNWSHALREFFSEKKYLARANILSSITKKDVGYIVCLSSDDYLSRKKDKNKFPDSAWNKFGQINGITTPMPFSSEEFRKQSVEAITHAGLCLKEEPVSK